MQNIIKSFNTQLYPEVINKSRKISSDHFWVFLLLVLSGNPAFYKQSWSNDGLVIASFIFVSAFFTKITTTFIKEYLLYISGFILIFIVQYFNLGFVSVPFALGFFIKAFIGSVVFYTLKERFAPVLFDVMYLVCLISLPFYIIHFFWGDEILSKFYLLNNPKTIGLYTFRSLAYYETILRNSGMFWEPGAFQGYINIALFMNLYQMKHLLKYQKTKILVIIISLITTYSTTGFLVFFLILIIYYLFYNRTSKIARYSSVIIITLLAFYIYNNNGYLREKILFQYERAINLEGEYSGERIGALLFDLHYIRKNPLTGNGFHEKTRYADHPEILLRKQSNENIGHGNGFSNFLACAGIAGIFWYLFFILRSHGKLFLVNGLLFILIVTVLLQGEQFLNFAFFISLPFYVPGYNIEMLIDKLKRYGIYQT